MGDLADTHLERTVGDIKKRPAGEEMVRCRCSWHADGPKARATRQAGMFDADVDLRVNGR
ncbi:hypothetical protein ACG2OD_06730 [Streptomyces sp. PDY-4]|uniref:hypothetical protein n=1 Tax=Streptomyces TaxID=1883 RepID=UPI00167DB107|nr:hypothetical protein [Streptomyces griseoflavus]GGV29437.1 hypothetical protein GCM10010293_29100 [Streptomyces griseoflavus]